MATTPMTISPLELRQRVSATAFAFRGYNVTNQGRSHELLAIGSYARILRPILDEASRLASDSLHRPVDLHRRLIERQPSSLETFAEDLCNIIALELGQVRLLQELFSIEYRHAQLAFGYSLGELAALACGGVFRMQDVLQPLLSMAADCAELARDVTMGVVFSRGEDLNIDAVGRMCAMLNREGKGVIGISAVLSPNTVLLLGQGDTIARFKQAMPEFLSSSVHLRPNQNRWPPLHTPILWQRNIPSRAAQLLLTLPRGLEAPTPPVLSMVTGRASYNDYNARDLIYRWIDQPQRLWDVVTESLSAGVEIYLHTGPEANLIPATFSRLAENVLQQTKGLSASKLGLRAVFRIARRPWLASWLTAKAALLRAPYVQHVLLEDWLIEHAPRA